MLQEANLLREWVVARAKGGTSGQDLDADFLEVESVLRRALDLIREDRANRPIRIFLLVELGSALASQATQKIDHPYDAINQFREARNALLEARIQDSRNYHPIYVLAWATRNMLKSGTLSPRESIEAIADVLYAFQTADPAGFDPEQQERFHARRLEFAESYGMQPLADEAFEALSTQGSCAGYYVRALRMSGLAR